MAKNPKPKGENKYVTRFQAQLDRIQDKTEQEFLKTRVMETMEYYSRTSARAKKRYQLFALLSIVFNGVIPVLLLLTDLGQLEFWVRLLAAALSAAAGILTAISGLKNYRELWIQYQVSLERLKALLDRYFLGVGDFAETDPKKRREALQTQYESILSEENSKWQEWLTEARKKT